MKPKDLKPGDHLKVSNPLYDHVGIYEGCIDGVHYVIHFTEPTTNAGKRNAVVACTTWEEFAKGRTVHVVNSEAKYPGEEIVRRARSKIGVRGYNFITNNCEHFVSWCRTNVARSPQATAAITVGLFSYRWKQAGFKQALTELTALMGVGLLGSALAQAVR